MNLDTKFIYHHSITHLTKRRTKGIDNYSDDPFACEIPAGSFAAPKTKNPAVSEPSSRQCAPDPIYIPDVLWKTRPFSFSTSIRRSFSVRSFVFISRVRRWGISDARKGATDFPRIFSFPGLRSFRILVCYKFHWLRNLCIHRIKMQWLFSTSSDDCLLGDLSINGNIMFEHIFWACVCYRRSLYDLFPLQWLFQSWKLEMVRFLISLTFELWYFKLDTDIVEENIDVDWLRILIYNIKY